MDIVSISSSVELPPISDNDDFSKIEGAEESKARGAKSTDANHFEVSSKLRIMSISYEQPMFAPTWLPD